MKSEGLRAVALAITVALSFAVALVTLTPGEALAQSSCREITLTGTGGFNAGLNQFFELGVRCNPGDPFYFIVGGRWSDLNPSVNPFATLSYTRPLSGGWSAILAAGYRERLGDFEGHRLPELTLRYGGSANGWVPSLELSAGWFQIVAPEVQASRYGGTLALQSPTGRLGAGTEAIARMKVGGYGYSTGESNTFYSAGVEFMKKLGDRGSISLSYDNVGGSGTSPLLFDAPYVEQLLTGRLFTWTADGGMTGMIYASFTLHTPAIEGKEYGVELRSSKGWYIGAAYRVSDSRAFLTFGF